MVGEMAVAAAALDTIGLLALVRIYFVIKKDTKETLDKFGVRVLKLEDTTITKKDFKELLELNLKPVAIQLANINGKLGDISETKIK